MKRVTLVKLFVNNQDEALQFYTKKLGFEVAEDSKMGDYRWLLVRLPDNKEFCLANPRAATRQSKGQAKEILRTEQSSGRGRPSRRSIARRRTSAGLLPSARLGSRRNSTKLSKARAPSRRRISNIPSEKTYTSLGMLTNMSAVGNSTSEKQPTGGATDSSRRFWPVGLRTMAGGWPAAE